MALLDRFRIQSTSVLHGTPSDASIYSSSSETVSHCPRKRAKTDDVDECVIRASKKIADNGGRLESAKTFGTDLTRLIFSVHIVNFDSFFGNFLLNQEMSNFNVLCSCDGFD